MIRYSVREAYGCRDGLAHEIYGNLFGWVVALANRSLSRTDGATVDGAAGEAGAVINEAAGQVVTGAATKGEGSSAARYIAILDIFGFENQAENLLEQVRSGR